MKLHRQDQALQMVSRPFRKRWKPLSANRSTTTGLSLGSRRKAKEEGPKGGILRVFVPSFIQPSPSIPPRGPAEPPENRLAAIFSDKWRPGLCDAKSSSSVAEGEGSDSTHRLT